VTEPYETALDRLLAEQYSHRGETREELVARLRRDEGSGSLPDLALRRSTYQAEVARTATRGTAR